MAEHWNLFRWTLLCIGEDAVRSIRWWIQYRHNTWPIASLYRTRWKAGPKFGEFCTCCSLLLLPALATWAHLLSEPGTLCPTPITKDTWRGHKRGMPRVPCLSPAVARTTHPRLNFENASRFFGDWRGVLRMHYFRHPRVACAQAASGAVRCRFGADALKQSQFCRELALRGPNSLNETLQERFCLQSLLLKERCKARIFTYRSVIIVVAGILQSRWGRDGHQQVHTSPSLVKLYFRAQ